MSIYKSWISQAYDQNGQTVPSLWQEYLPLEQRIYEGLIESSSNHITGTIAELARQHDIPSEFFAGFIDGINDALDNPLSQDVLDEMDENTAIDICFQFDALYKKMVEYQADHLYNLSQWNMVFSQEQRARLYTQQKRSTTVVKQEGPGRNSPCPCGSSKKFKKCCGVSV